MVSSVSSKYLNYNVAGGTGRGSIHSTGGQSKIEGVSTINGDPKIASEKLNNFNEYQHVYNDPHSNEANVAWITKLRDYD